LRLRGGVAIGPEVSNGAKKHAKKPDFYLKMRRLIAGSVAFPDFGGAIACNDGGVGLAGVSDAGYFTRRRRHPRSCFFQ
jgi:hypothetical protein